MPTYPDSELLVNKLAEFKKSAHLSRVNTNFLLILLQSVNPAGYMPA